MPSMLEANTNEIQVALLRSALGSLPWRIAVSKDFFFFFHSSLSSIFFLFHLLNMSHLLSSVIHLYQILTPTSDARKTPTENDDQFPTTQRLAHHSRHNNPVVRLARLQRRKCVWREPESSNGMLEFMPYCYDGIYYVGIARLSTCEKVVDGWMGKSSFLKVRKKEGER